MLKAEVSHLRMHDNMNWDPWTGCYKISDGCTYCYFYGPFSKRYRQNEVHKTNEFDKPIAKTLKGADKIQSGKIVATCFASDWGDGYDNVNIGCSIENQELADYRLPLFQSYPIKKRFIAAAPLLGAIDLSAYLGGVEHVTVGGETGREARICNYDWVLELCK